MGDVAQSMNDRINGVESCVHLEDKMNCSSRMSEYSDSEGTYWWEEAKKLRDVLCGGRWLVCMRIFLAAMERSGLRSNGHTKTEGLE